MIYNRLIVILVLKVLIVFDYNDKNFFLLVLVKEKVEILNLFFVFY